MRVLLGVILAQVGVGEAGLVCFVVLQFGAVRQAEPQFDVRSEGFGAFLHERHVLLPARRASGTDGNADFYLAAAVLATAQA